MNTPLNGDQLSRLLSDGLHAKAADASCSGLTVDQVRGHAGRLKRNRRVATGIAVAAAAAVIGPAIALAGPSFQRGAEPPVTNPSPSIVDGGEPSPTPSDEPTGSTSGDYQPGDPVLLDKLPLGGALGAAWAEIPLDGMGGTIHAPDETTVSLPADEQVVAFAPLGERWIVQTADLDGYRNFVMEASGELSDPWPAAGMFASSTDGTLAAWVDLDGKVAVANAAGEVIEWGQVSGKGPFTVTAVGGTGSCSGGRECAVYIRNDGPSGQPAQVIATDGATELAGRLRIADLGDLVYDALISASDDGSCSAWFALSGEKQWETCDYTLAAISPDSQRVLGLPAYFDGLGYGDISVLDAADGTPVRSWPSTRRSVTFTTTMWESDDALIAHVVDPPTGENAVVRLRMDGSAELIDGTRLPEGTRVLLAVG